MPYFLFRINNHREYTLCGRFDAYREARKRARELRAEHDGAGNVDFRMAFAESDAEARDLLRSPRERIPSEDD